MAAALFVSDYVSGFRDRLSAMQRPGRDLIDEPGILGLAGQSAETLDGRVLVYDDQAVETLAARLSVLFARVVTVFESAKACSRLISGSDGYRPNPCTAMVCDDLGGVPHLALPTDLSLRPVAVAGEDEASVPLAAAAQAALRSDPEMAPSTDPGAFLAYLRSIPHARYLAAVDPQGAVRATAAVANWGTTTGVFFVNTDPAWRGRGVGTAMTAAALRAAATAGAERACLDASALGLSLYQRLGFESAGTVTQYVDVR